MPPFRKLHIFRVQVFREPSLHFNRDQMIFYAGEAHAELCILAYFTVVPRLVEIAGCSLRRIAEVVVVPSANAYAFDFVFLCVSRARDCAGAVADEDGMFVRRELVSDEREPDGLSTGEKLGTKGQQMQATQTLSQIHDASSIKIEANDTCNTISVDRGSLLNPA